MKTPKKKKLYDIQQWFGQRHIATIAYQKPYAMAKSIKRIAEINPWNLKGTYFKLVENVQKASV